MDTMESFNRYISSVNLDSSDWLDDLLSFVVNDDSGSDSSPSQLSSRIESWFIDIDQLGFTVNDQRTIHILSNYAYHNFGESSFFEKSEISRELKDRVLFHLWLNGCVEYFDLKRWRNYYDVLIPALQPWFLKRYFNLVHRQEITFSIDFLKDWVQVLEQESEFPLAMDKFDLSTRVVLEALFNYKKTNYLVSPSRIFDLAFTKLSIEQELFRFDMFFDKCLGRSVEVRGQWREGIPFNAFPLISEGEKYFFLKNTGVASRDELVAMGWRMGNKNKTWFIEKEHKARVEELARNKGCVVYGKEFKIVPDQLIQKKRVEQFKPKNLTLCEGHLHYKKHEYYGCDRWLCRGGYCYETSVSLKAPDDWFDYSLLDFLVLSDLEVKYPQDIYGKQRKKYFDFVGWINRFNDAMEHMSCRECNKFLRPAESNSPEAIYRTTKFSCTNNKCKKFGEEVTITHCFNHSCQSTIDSRDSKRCPNGLLICNNEECGCCCSEKNRYDRDTGEKIKGHYESKEHFCYKCGGQMLEKEPYVYECHSEKHKEVVSYRVGFWESRLKDQEDASEGDPDSENLPF